MNETLEREIKESIIRIFDRTRELMDFLQENLDNEDEEVRSRNKTIISSFIDHVTRFICDFKGFIAKQ